LIKIRRCPESNREAERHRSQGGWSTIVPQRQVFFELLTAFQSQGLKLSVLKLPNLLEDLYLLKVCPNLLRKAYTSTIIYIFAFVGALSRFVGLEIRNIIFYLFLSNQSSQ
jgi:hypothetical protein